MAGKNKETYLRLVKDSQGHRSKAQHDLLHGFVPPEDGTEEDLSEAMYESFNAAFLAAAESLPPAPSVKEPVKEKPVFVPEDYEVIQPISGDSDEVKLLNLFRTFFMDLAHDPKTGVLMTDPVIAPDGFCYERATLEHYLNTHNSLTPQAVRVPTSQLQRREVILPNSKLRRAIEAVEEGRLKPLSHAAELELYVTFVNEVAFEPIDFMWIQDPLVLGVNDYKTGGIVSRSARERTDKKFKMNPDSGIVLERGEILPHRIVYRRHQQALKKLQEGLLELQNQAVCFPDITSDTGGVFEIAKLKPLASDFVAQQVPLTQRSLNRWWTLGHLHQAWYKLGTTSYTSWNFLLYVIKAPITLTVGTVFTPISAFARYFFPEKCEPSRNPVQVKQDADRDVSVFSVTVTGLCLYTEFATEHLAWPALKLIWAAEELGIGAFLPISVVAPVLTALYILLVATAVTAAIGSPLQPVPVPVPEEKAIESIPEVTVPEEFEIPANTAVPAYTLWRGIGYRPDPIAAPCAPIIKMAV